jgi:uncharacterized damage-inducible protein DinB
MSQQNLAEPWLRGTLGEVHPVIRAVLHALELAKEDLWKWCYPLTLDQLNQASPGVAPVSFHLRHIARSLDRLLSYAEGSQLDDRQLLALRTELEPATSHGELFRELSCALERSRARLVALRTIDFAAARSVGREKMASTVGGLVVHVADHTQRHVGQAITTAKVLALL